MQIAQPRWQFTMMRSTQKLVYLKKLFRIGAQPIASSAGLRAISMTLVPFCCVSVINIKLWGGSPDR